MSIRLGASVGLALVIFVACGEPSDPTIPDGPPGADGGPYGGDAQVADVDNGDAQAADVSVSACDGQTDGTPCGNGKICVGSACLDPACGDGIVTAPEECDRGPGNAAGSGCETTCLFTCAAADATRNCKSADPCISDGTCSATLHTCTEGSPLASGTTCGTYKFCAGGVCTNGSCGDGVVTTPPEACDNGNANGPGTGCETTCQFSCSNAATDCSTPAPACNKKACSAQHTCTSVPDPTLDGTHCGAGNTGTCSGGACNMPGATCGNGVVESGEDCDFGTGTNGPGTGCEVTCKFSCATLGSPSSCTDPNPCDNAPSCAAVTVNGHAGQKCVNGSAKPDGTVCGTGSICIADVCKTSVCGDGVRDDAKGEQCDDGNTTNLDACDATCKFEQDQRAIALKMQWATDAYCTANVTGGAIKSIAQSTMQGDVDSSVADGSLSALFKLVGDPTGASGAVTAGSLSGTPTPYVAPASGTSDMDWWYTADPTSIDGSRNALAQLTGTYSGGAMDLTGTLNLNMNIGGSNTVLHVSSAKVHAPIGGTTTPATSSANPPGHLSSEHLSPTLKSYGTMGGSSSAPSAQLCGNISANSLANTAVPAALLSGFTKCSEGYTTQNRVLDVFVNGCHVLGNVAIAASQPDQVDPAMPAAGAGGPYKLSVDAQKRVNACKDKNGTTVTLTTCLNAAAFSSSFKFATDRVIIK